MRNFCLVTVLCFTVCYVFAQTLAPSRAVDWSLAGLRMDTSINYPVFDMQLLGAINDAVTPNDSVIINFVDTFSGQGAVLKFAPGSFMFNKRIILPSNFTLRGSGADSTTFLMDLGGVNDAVYIRGVTTSDSSLFMQPVSKDNNHIVVWDDSGFVSGDWVQIIQYDLDLVTSSWAQNSVGQVVQIDSVFNNSIWFKSPLRMDYDTARSPYILKVIPKQNIGIECLKFKRIDDTAPTHTSTIQFKYAVNCWVTGIESENCTVSHVLADQCSNLYIARSYFHHGFDYGGGGRAYGIVFQYATGECLAEDNVFEHLRHSMLLQAGANGNVFAYNYSFDPYWASTPSDAAGDMVLHGNYVYSNLFEQNICRNIVIDNSHGPNGPYNTFFRNRSEGYGIFFSASNSPDQNFLGNDITNTGFPYSLVNYTILGSGHFVYGSNDKGTIKPSGTQALPEQSLFYTGQPPFVPSSQYAKIGTPNAPGVADIPAKDRFNGNTFFSSSCTNIITKTSDILNYNTLSVYPNPVSNVLFVESDLMVENVYICNELGQVLKFISPEKSFFQLDFNNLSSGVLFLKFQFSDASSEIRKIININN